MAQRGAFGGFSPQLLTTASQAKVFEAQAAVQPGPPELNTHTVIFGGRALLRCSLCCSLCCSGDQIRRETTTITAPSSKYHKLHFTSKTFGGTEEGQKRDRGGTEEGQRSDRGGTEEGQRRDRGGTEEGQRRDRQPAVGFRAGRTPSQPSFLSAGTWAHGCAAEGAGGGEEVQARV